MNTGQCIHFCNFYWNFSSEDSEGDNQVYQHNYMEEITNGGDGDVSG